MIAVPKRALPAVPKRAPTVAPERAAANTPVLAVCFARERSAVAGQMIDASALPHHLAQALSNTLPFLRCGEESAVHAFGRRLARAGIDAEQAALDAITADEARHADWLAALAAALPPSSSAPDATAMAAFFRRLLTRDAALHFARVAALDLAVCAILRPLVARHSALTAAPQVLEGLRAIHRDEARHVRTARDCAARLGWGASAQRHLDLAMRHDLAALLAPVRASLATLGFIGFDGSDRFDGFDGFAGLDAELAMCDA